MKSVSDFLTPHIALGIGILLVAHDKDLIGYWFVFLGFACMIVNIVKGLVRD